MGSNVTEFEIDWLYRSRHSGRSCRIPGDEIEPDPKAGEYVVFLAHFERGFGLPASPFFREFLDFYKLQPHHLPANAIFYLSCYATFMEAYIGIRPTRETFARFFCLRINSVQGKEIPKPKPPVECGSCIVGSRQGSTFLKFSGLESCRAWQGTFFYVKNSGRANLIDLPPYQAGPPSRTNWSYNPKTDHAETNRVVRFLASLKKETNICSDDIIRTFISRRVLPLKRRAHRMSEMYGPGDPTKITGRPLSKKDVVRKAKQICQTAMPFAWEWGLLPLSTTNPPTQEAKDRFPLIEAERRGTFRKRALDSFDPDPYIFWKDLKMGKTPAARLGRDPPEPTGTSDDPTVLEPALKLGSGQRALKVPQGLQPLLLTQVRHLWCRQHFCLPLGGTTNRARGPNTSDHRAEEDFTSPPEAQDAGASNIGAGKTDAGQAEPLVPPPPKKKKKQPSSSPTAPDTSAPVPSPPPEATPTPPPSQGPSAAKRPAPSETPKITKFLKPGASRGKAVEGDASGGSRDVVLHVGPAAIAAQDKPTGLLGRIVDLKRAGKDLGHLLPYAQKWNEADISASTRGLGKDRLPAPDPAGARSTEEHFTRLKRAVKEFDSAWYDATNNVVSTADARKQLFEELLWEHRDLAEAHSHCQVVPEATIEALKAQVAKLHGDKEQLLKEHNEALDAQKTALREVKDQAMQAALQHEQALKDARVAAEAKLAEVVEDSTNSNTVLAAELEEERKARKAAERLIDTMTTDHKEYDRLVMKIDALALQHFPESQVYAVKKVREDRIAREFPNLDAHWDGYDYLVALSARVQHMRCVDRLLADLPAAAIQVFKDAGHRIREWQCSAARAGADTALRSACSWYPDVNLDALQGVREDAPTDTDPALTAKRQDRAYRLAEYAEVRTFIPPPPGVKDYLSDEEEEDEGDEDEAAEDVPPEAPEASTAPPEDAEAGAA
ncbi:hypothetical protein QYE76_008884 [Lolium multiflorum]|uniref:Transposase (putative) gypsy type domain-containing protein n=1 Tax=Lolium multiflorum TaxID=4521 RepID=A0AAD8TU44_LOLMU|nr:hypothetical protein QYE76_008884 [Lolium multiflorum]